MGPMDILRNVRVKNGPLVKRPKTPPFHGGNTGSNPVRVTKAKAEKRGRLAQLGERLPYKQDVGSSILSSPTKDERHQ